MHVVFSFVFVLTAVHHPEKVECWYEYEYSRTGLDLHSAFLYVYRGAHGHNIRGTKR